MQAWMRSIAALLRSRCGRGPAGRGATPRRDAGPAAGPRRDRHRAAVGMHDARLEGRALLAATVTPFAALTGAVTSASKASTVTLHLNPGELRADAAPTVIVGFAVEPVAGSSVSPEITQITGPNGRITPLTPVVHGTTAADRAARQTHTFARIIPLGSSTEDITLNVATLNKKTGSYIVEAYLAGDVNGDGTVDAADLTALQAAYGSSQGEANYTAAADFNGDGRVGCIDRSLTTANLGAHVVAPATTAAASTLAVPIGEVNLYTAPAAVAATGTAVPIAVATPYAVATPTGQAATGYIPITYGSAAAVPVATTATPVYYASGTTTAPTGAATPVYLIPQATAASTTAAPVYLYNQPVGGTANSVGSTLFGQTAAVGTATTAATPVPVYLYGTPTYTTPANYAVHT